MLADVTFIDNKDGFGTLINDDFFRLTPKDDLGPDTANAQGATGKVGLGNFASEPESEKIIQPDFRTDALLYGIHGDWAVYDGQERRGLVLFFLDAPGREDNWILTSPYLEELKLPISQETYMDPDLLVEKEADKILDDEFETLLAEAVNKVILLHQSRKAAQGTPVNIQRVSFSQEEGKNSIPKPPISTNGAQKLNSVTNVQDVIETMKENAGYPANINIVLITMLLKPS